MTTLNLNNAMNKNFDLLIDSYLENKIGIDTGFMTQSLSEGLRQNILQLQSENRMAVAGIGNDMVTDRHQKIRGDKIYWMDKSHSNSFEKEFLELVNDFVGHLNETCYTGINSYEFHYAVYEEGNFYKRHKDQFRNDSNRKYSLISYLNEDWKEEDGGQLQIYQDGKIKRVMPQSQTAVFFKSDEIEHEVLKANRQRMSVTGWLKQV
jgi:SM-20-related protein